jgi:hypothetical protein
LFSRFSPALLILALGLSQAAPTAPIRFAAAAQFGYRHEPGVETKLYLRASGELGLGRRIHVFGGIGLSAFDNPGIAGYGLGASATLMPAIGLRAGLLANHNQWSDWQTGENRISAILAVRPVRALDVELGLAYRVPLLDSAAWYSPLVWSGAAPELNYLYRLDWTFFSRPRSEIAAWVANFDRFTAHTAQQFPFGLRGAFRPDRHWRLSARLGSDIKGLSGLLLSLGEVQAELGTTYVF